MATTTRDLTTGGIAGPILAFSIPLILGNMLQTLYNAADSIIVGRFVGAEALAAVGSAYSLMTFLTSLMIGLSMGAGIVFSYLFGEGNQEKLRKALGISFMSIGIISLVITAIALIFQHPIMRLMQVPQDVYEDMAEYLKVIFIGLPALFLYNFYAAAERAVGNSRTPLLFMAVSAIMNVILDLYFVISLDWGVWGAAVATIISQWVAGIGIAVFSISRHQMLRFSLKDMVPEKSLFSELLSLSVLTSMQQSIMNLGILCVQGIVNSFGSGVMAAFAAGVKIDSIAYMPLQEFGNAFSTFVSQNGGAGKTERIREGMRVAFMLATLFGLIISIIVFIIPGPLMTIFIDPGETELIAIGSEYLRIEGAFYILIGYLFLFYGIFRALKAPAISLVLTIISLGLRVLLAALLSRLPMGETGIWMSIPIGWALADAAGIIFYKTLKKRRAS
ncbi:MAG: MATE family efflux transporter [Spirochaetes bacterium]|uniref:Multidrug-efflux transporter n=1 Tax=Candidatus Ornithospirochaeta stercoripullorum TaxID=2840899 RepID=A0A9D9E0C2_9SPIO|nr:MATE family efflux transporter [Candidatus Ornithospirochaeta stercoripullorum]